MIERLQDATASKGQYWHKLSRGIRRHLRSLSRRIAANGRLIREATAREQRHHREHRRARQLQARVRDLERQLNQLRQRQGKGNAPPATTSPPSFPASPTVPFPAPAAPAPVSTTFPSPPPRPVLSPGPVFDPNKQGEPGDKFYDVANPAAIHHALRRHRSALQRLRQRARMLYFHIRRGQRRLRVLRLRLDDSHGSTRLKVRVKISRLHRRLRHLKRDLFISIGEFMRVRESLYERKKEYLLIGELRLKEALGSALSVGQRRRLLSALGKMRQSVLYIDREEDKLDRKRRELVHRTYHIVITKLRTLHQTIVRIIARLKERRSAATGLSERHYRRRIARMENKLDAVASRLSRVRNTAHIHQLVLKREVLRRKARELRRRIRAARSPAHREKLESKLHRLRHRMRRLHHSISRARRVVMRALHSDRKSLHRRKTRVLKAIEQLRERLSRSRGRKHRRLFAVLRRRQHQAFSLERRLQDLEHKITIISRLVFEAKEPQATPGWHPLTHTHAQHISPPVARPVPSPEQLARTAFPPPDEPLRRVPTNSAPLPFAVAAPPLAQVQPSQSAPPALGSPAPLFAVPAPNAASLSGQKARQHPRKVLLMCLRILAEEKQAMDNARTGAFNNAPAPPGPSPQQLQVAADRARASLLELRSRSKAQRTERLRRSLAQLQGGRLHLQLDASLLSHAQSEVGRYCQEVVKSYQDWRLSHECHGDVVCAQKVPYGVNLDVPAALPAPVPRSWNYAQGGADWQLGVCLTGRMQSPIKLDEGHVNITTNRHEFRGNNYQLRLSYHKAMNLTLHHHDGYAISVRSSVPGTLGYLRSGCCDESHYHVASFHFHSKGEHAFGGRSQDDGHYPMEMHIVHRKEGNSGATGVLIVVIPFELKRTPGGNRFLDSIGFDNLPRAVGE